EEHARRVGKAARSHDDEVRALLRRSVHDRVRDVAGRAVHELAPGLDARLVRLLHGLGDEPRLLRRALDHVRRRAAAVVLGDVDDEELRVELLRHLDRDWERLPGAPRSVDGHHDVVEHSHHLDADGRGGRGAGVGPAGPSQRADRPFEHYETVTLERCAGITYGAASRTRPRPQARMIHVITIVWFRNTSSPPIQPMRTSPMSSAASGPKRGLMTLIAAVSRQPPATTTRRTKPATK